MSYLGENDLLSFRDNFCEVLPNKNFTSANAADFGISLPAKFGSIAVGCADEKMRHILFALCSGIADSGRDAYICENTDLPSFKHGVSIINPDLGIYISGSRRPTFSFFSGTGFPANKAQMRSIFNSERSETPEFVGKIIPVSSLNDIYIANISENISSEQIPVNARVSCGNKHIRKLWNEFFRSESENDSLIFQVSDDGQHVNAYSSEIGFISHDRLILAFSLRLWRQGQAVFLPENFHYAADDLAEKYGYRLNRFCSDTDIPHEAVSQRFLNDPLFMCVKIVSEYSKFIRLIKETPVFASAKREIYYADSANIHGEKHIIEALGRIHITSGGKNRITLIAQSYDAETAAELCSEWDEKLSNAYTNLFHADS
ncbi:MAG: hypothetical protein LUG91_02375 [Ruminococcus sp.]|nr:hypothetical protein [Ruminococcus sp.]